MWRTRRVFLYLLTETFPSFVLGIVVFISILLMFQALRLTEFVLVHGVQLTTLKDIIFYMSISFLPLLLPMSLLFAILMSYNRMSQDSEIIALKAVGVPGLSLLYPALILATIISIFSAQVSNDFAPWGNRQFELLISKLSQSKAAASIKEGTFSDGFYDMVVYANKVDSNTGKIKDLFIYDEHYSKSPITVIAPEAELITNTSDNDHNILLRLYNGEIHRQKDSHTVVNFNSYDISLNDPIRWEGRQKSPPSLTYRELNYKRTDRALKADDRLQYELEYHKRFALSFACIVFSLVGVAFGIQNDRRSGKSSGFVLSVGFIILYWVCYLVFESLSRKGILPVWISSWMTNIVFTFFSVLTLRKKLA